MIKIVNIGMNHETAPVELRELAAFGGHNIDEVMNAISSIKDIKESIVLSTCNRVEILFTTDNEKGGTESVIDFLCRYSQISREKLLPILYIYNDQEAIRHIFRVGASLDSLIIGEPQILGQVKEAYRIAVDHKSSSVILNKLMHRTFSLAKKIRTETEISGSAVSISFAAVELGKKIFGDLEGKKVLLIGAGEMAELAATYLVHNRVDKIKVANRTFRRAVEVADQFHGETISFEEIGDQLLYIDIVITSTASPEPIISSDQVKKAMKGRKNRPLFFIDIAVPRNVESRVNEIENAFVYNMDDLKGIIESNLSKRKNEAVKAERMVDEEVIKFSEWLKTLDVVPTIVALKEKCKKIRQIELKKTLSRLGNLTPEQRKRVEDLALSITKKVLNDPIVFLKGKENRSSRDLYLDITQKLFNLGSDNENTNKKSYK
ncbi:MAG: glutamyl-tRNA reductase [Deltaproteobacteria bacterium]|nr:glutamyl-tRNA reductase [Deltaproteobacteria bacterium]MCD6265713.1 glutamyl-tRNA reductase [Deltaproteobacteria bacterium]RLB24908.1 MAG: glutamyl-tRNA reductase [Deltaproteobacteria bacterium]HDH87351.1 glutamyl-tRNA reductase [Desulfobacteraceae bacterium]